MRIKLPPVCASPIPEYGTSCVGVEGYMECTTYLKGYICLNESGGGGGYNPYPGGVGPGGGGGGAPPSTETPILASELNTDSIKNKYPCVDKLILQPILLSPAMSDFVKPFLSNMRPTITFKTTNLSWGSEGVYQLGQTAYDPSSRRNLSTIVTLNEKMFENSSPLLNASTVVHETIHSYIYYNVSNSEEDSYVSYQANKNWLVALNSFYLIRSLPANYSNHTMMLTDYFEKGLSVLRAWNKTQSIPYSEKEIAMLYGLDMVDPDTPQNLVNNINSVFATQIEKLGITRGDLNSFNIKNLNSTNKLPKNCN